MEVVHLVGCFPTVATLTKASAWSSGMELAADLERCSARRGEAADRRASSSSSNARPIDDGGILVVS